MHDGGGQRETDGVAQMVFVVFFSAQSDVVGSPYDQNTAARRQRRNTHGRRRATAAAVTAAAVKRVIRAAAARYINTYRTVGNQSHYRDVVVVTPSVAAFSSRHPLARSTHTRRSEFILSKCERVHAHVVVHSTVAFARLCIQCIPGT